MQRAVAAVGLLLVTLLAGCLGGGGDDLDAAAGLAPGWMEDAVVVAVVDFGFNPYHVEWDAANHPANRDGDPATDFAFDQPPHEYLPGFPAPELFASYGALNTTRPSALDEEAMSLRDQDERVWENFTGSTRDEVAYHWVPDTKVIGLVSFSGGSNPAPVANSNSHGAKVASVSVGSLYGACPECLLVFVEHGPGALEWVNSQPWIDVVTNSYGASGALARAADEEVYPSFYGAVWPFVPDEARPLVPGEVQGVAGQLWLRTHVYDGDDTRLTREAVERGQTTVFSAGNGLRNSYNIPTTPLTSSQRGPDWILRVGAIYHDTENSPFGVGKPVDVASIGSGYPSQGHPTVSTSGTFSGTSNAAPVTAGMLARVLFQARLAMEGPSRTQEDGVVAAGAFTCGEAQPDCLLGKGTLTRGELVDTFLRAAEPVVEAWAPRSANVCVPSPLPGGCVWPDVPVVNDEMRMLVEGHGTFFGRFLGLEHWEQETARAVDQLTGDAAPAVRPDGEREWFQAISYCNQEFWGEWQHGWWVPGEALPAADAMWPTRTALVTGCEEAALVFQAYLDLADAG